MNDSGEGSVGHVFWVAGALVFGRFTGRAKTAHLRKHFVETLRCRRCDFLNNYARGQK
ncbi:hypothetical protein [Amycolatopsis sp. NPDC059657]|uniref:hypothetical protein n=1 Tax=Amycolatopsis sp. NPDC059657 TaxID=3346899 RepID=UPI003670D2A6